MLSKKSYKKKNQKKRKAGFMLRNSTNPKRSFKKEMEKSKILKSVEERITGIISNVELYSSRY